MATTLTQEQFRQRYGNQGLNQFGLGDVQPQEKPGFFSRVGEKLKGRGEDITESFRKVGSQVTGGEERLAKTEVGAGARLALRTGGAVVGGIFDVLFEGIKSIVPDPIERAVGEGIRSEIRAIGEAAKFIAPKPVEEKFAEVTNNLGKWIQQHPEAVKDLENIVDLAGVVPGVKVAQTVLRTTGQVLKTGIKTSIKVGNQAAKRTFDITKSIPERISNIRKSIRKTDTPVPPTPSATQVGFTNNPAVSGAIDDIKIMVGLPESTPSVDLTFRAIKPRLTKSTDLRRIKTQMELANQTIVESGFKPTNIREYADAVYQTKKNVWKRIQSRLDAGQLDGLEIDLTPIALKILDRAEDSALLRTNSNAAKQLTKIAEDLVRQGDTVDILEAERIKQFINAELDGSFGTFDLSQQAKEAKKLITKEIGIQLDSKLSNLPEEFKNLKIQYGSLSAIEDDILKRAIVFERQNPEGLADILTKTEAATEIAFGGIKGKLKGIARLTIGRKLKKANDVNDLIKRAFEKLKPSK